MDDKQGKLQLILDKAIDNKKVFGASFCIKNKGELYFAASGNMEEISQYFIASTTKLFTTAVILNLRSNGKLKLEDSISKYIEPSILEGLHKYKNNDYSSNITIKNLLAHTSGLPDYFQGKDDKGQSLEVYLIEKEDRGWSFEESVQMSKKLKPLFPPGTNGKANYSDTNFQILGKIIEFITEKSLSENYQELIINPLALSNTYLYTDISDKRPRDMYYKNKVLHIPKAMTSFEPDGGIVSSTKDMIQFIESFFKGKFFPESYIPELKVWNPIFFPMQSGIGIHRFKLPWIFNPFGVVPELIGHSGLSGALAYCNLEKDLFITGTVNQIAYPETSFKLAIKLIQSLR
jgi:CubicO group peptidase (beta-lactamase class C family)